MMDCLALDSVTVWLASELSTAIATLKARSFIRYREIP